MLVSARRSRADLFKTSIRLSAICKENHDVVGGKYINSNELRDTRLVAIIDVTVKCMLSLIWKQKHGIFVING